MISSRESGVSKTKTISRRMFILSAAKVIIITAIVGRLFSLQISQGSKYKNLSDKNRLREWKISPQRGIIEDFFGKTIAANDQVFQLHIIPEQVKDQFISCSNAAIKAANQASAAVRKVDEMQKSGFGSNDAAALSDLVAHLEQIERENDELEIELRHSLFQCEKEYDPIDMVFLYDIINKIGSLADISQTVGHLLVRLISR